MSTLITWKESDLRHIADGDDLHVAPLRSDGSTYGTPTWVWSVAVYGSLHVRACQGTNSRCYQGALRQRFGRITSAGMTRAVSFEPAGRPFNQRIDEACRAKYPNSPYLAPMIGERDRYATMRVVPVAPDHR